MSQDRKISTISDPTPLGSPETLGTLEDTPFPAGSQTSDSPAESGPPAASDGPVTGIRPAHTPGPWAWSVNRTHKSVTLTARGRGGLQVMGFERWGMNGAAPQFLHREPEPGGLLLVRRADAFATPIRGREHHADWCAAINHPDARLIAASPQLLDSLLAVEWAGVGFNDHGDPFDCCGNCGAPSGGFHYAHCELRDSLDAALGIRSPRAEVVHG